MVFRLPSVGAPPMGLAGAAREPGRMTRLVALIATLAAGAVIAFQPPINSDFGRRTTVLTAAFVSTAIAAAVMGIMIVVLGQMPHLRRVLEVPPQLLIGGLLGAVFVTISLTTVRTLGAGGLLAATVTGQVVVSAVLDRFRLVGLEQASLTPTRVAGLAFLLLGTALVGIR